MSVEAITWALKQPVAHSSAKFVLVVLANCASAESALAFPSVAYLASATGQDRKTVIQNLARLCAAGFIEDSGERMGRTRQIVAYRLTLEVTERQPKPERSQKRKGSDIPGKESRFSAQTVPKTGHGTVNNHQEQGVCGGAAVSSAALAAIALRRVGLQVTSQHPNLIAAIDEGVTVEQLVEVAQLHPGKPAGYVLAAARRERAERPTPVVTTSTGAPRHEAAKRGSAFDRVLANVQRAHAAGHVDDFDDRDGFIEGHAERITR